ncbi:unnamed protein product [Durusdinium trenchii]|uniref:DUF7869 domain-containing protein n=1 Tax=Durusdinium trenchii TaxID=1381693 RepID=A0ABP0LHS8_9DINO
MEEEAQIPPVTTLSDSSEEVAPPPAPAHGIKRKRDKGDGSKKKPSSDDVVRIQCMLGKKGHCKKNCKHHFRGKQGFEELRQFRREWSQLHKTDQDEVVPYSLPVHILFIQDGMDQSKFMVPRHALMRAKAYESFIRPKLHVAAVIAHGRHVAFYVSEADLAKDSNTSCEILAHSLQQLATSGVQLSDCNVTLQADNTSREVKNGILMRYVASLVSDSIIRTGRLSFLRTGHSREDIDQLFGQVASWVKLKVRSALTSDDFVQGLKQFCAQLERPYEPNRMVIKLDVTRDWCFDSAVDAPAWLFGKLLVFASIVGFAAFAGWTSFRLMASPNEIPVAFQEQIAKFLPILRLPEFGLDRAADYLQSWCEGTWTRQLQLPSNYRNEARMYKDRSIYQAAAKVWAEGVPWPEALEICRASMGAVHVSFGNFKDVRSQVMANRGARMANNATRRPLHCFNILRQIKDWKNAAGLAKAFSLGKMESDAVFALSTDVPEPICSDLERLVTTRGMGRFLHHDVIGKGTFSKGWTSGVGLAESWSEPLTNLPRDFTLVKLYIQRLTSDHDATAMQLRRAVSFKDATKVHQACGAPYVTKIERGKTEDREQKVKELAQQVAAANLVHVKAQIAADTDTLRAKLPGKAEALAEHNLDMKYLRDRQTNLDVAV